MSRSIFNSSLLYILTAAIEKALPVLILPLISHTMPVDDYGKVSNYSVMISLAMLLVGSIEVQALNRYFKITGRVRKIFLFNGHISAVVLSVFVWFCLVVSQLIFGNSLGIGMPWILLSILHVISQLGFSLYSILLRYSDKPIQFSMLQISAVIMDLVLTVLWLYFYKMGANGRVLALVFSKVIVGVFALFLLYKNCFVIRLKYSLVYKSFAFASKLLLHQISGWVKIGLDKFIITTSLGLTIVGTYFVSFKVASVLPVFALAIFNSFAPEVYRKIEHWNKYSSSTSIRFINKTIVVYCMILFLGSFILHALFFYLSPLVLTEKYVLAREYTLPLILGMGFMSVYYLFGGILNYMNKPQVLSKISVVTTLIYLLGMFPIIRWFGIRGQAYWFCLNQLIFSFVCSVYARKYFPFFKTTKVNA